MLVVAVFIPVLAGCQPLPRPFANSATATDAVLLRPNAGSGVFIPPVAGLAPPAGRELAVAVARALGDADIPAHSRYANAASYVLAGQVADGEKQADGKRGVTLSWVLRSPQGGILGSHRQRLAEDRILRPEAAAELSAVIAALLGGENGGPETGASEPTAPRLGIWPVDGVAGAGGEALTAALRKALRRAGVTLADGLEDSDFLLLGSVHVAVNRGGAADSRHVEVTWSLIAKDGVKLGSVSQSNAVAAARLDRGWQGIAAAIAGAAAPAIADLLRRRPGF